AAAVGAARRAGRRWPRPPGAPPARTPPRWRRRSSGRRSPCGRTGGPPPRSPRAGPAGPAPPGAGRCGPPGGGVRGPPQAAPATWRTARSNAASVAAEVFWTPLTLRTYWRAAASISSGVAGGSSPRRVVMLRHMGARLPVPPQVLLDLGGEQAERAGDPVAGQ